MFLRGKDCGGMKLKLEFEEETVYDENANVTFNQLPESTREKITQLDEEIRSSTDLVDIIIGIHIRLMIRN